MNYEYNDGGRNQYFKGKCGDCVCRAIANATRLDYLLIYNDLKGLAKLERTSKRKKHISKVRDGVYKNTYKKYLIDVLKLPYVCCNEIGSANKLHLNTNDLPNQLGKSYIVSISKHLTCVRNHTIYDTYNCADRDYFIRNQFGETRIIHCEPMVYGYYIVDNNVDYLKIRNDYYAKHSKIKISRDKELER